MSEYRTYQQPSAYPPPAPPQPPRKRRHTLRWIFVGVGVLIVVIIAVSVGGAIGGAAHDINNQLNAAHTITYEVTGTAKQVSVDYVTDSNFSQAQEDPVTVPWSKTVKMNGDIGVTLEAQNKGETGTLTCVTKVDGKVTSTNTSSGAFTVVTCGSSN